MSKFNNVEELMSFMVNSGFKSVERKSNIWVMSCCPFHDDKNPSFGINVETLEGHCFLCGWFKWAEILSQMGLPIDEDLDMVDAFTGVAWRAVKDKFNFDDPKSIKFKRFGIPEGYDDILTCDKHMEYLESRGFDRIIMTEFNLKVCNDKSSKYYNRIILPVYNVTGGSMFFDARAIKPARVKYMRPLGAPVKYSLGGVDRLYMGSYNYVVIVEGYLDMMKLWQYEIPAVNTFGSNISSVQAKMIMQKHLDHIVLGFDPDQAGAKAREKALAMFEGCGSRIHHLRITVGKDPCSISHSDLVRLNPFMKSM